MGLLPNGFKQNGFSPFFQLLKAFDSQTPIEAPSVGTSSNVLISSIKVSYALTFYKKKLCGWPADGRRMAGGWPAGMSKKTQSKYRISFRKRKQIYLVFYC